MNTGLHRPRPLAAGVAWMRAHPWWALSIAVHAALLAGLWLHHGAPRPGQPPGLSAAQQARVAQSLERARRQHMQKHLRALEAVERELAGPDAAPQAGAPLPDDPAALLQRAREAVARIEQAEERRRAAELVRLTGLPRDEALARVQAQKPPPPPPTAARAPEQALRDLERRARELQARRLQDEARHRDGTPVARAPAGREAGAGAAAAGSAIQGRRGGGGGPSNTGDAAVAGLESGRGGGSAAAGRAGGPLESTMAVQEPRQYGAMRRPQVIDAATLRPERGLRLGAGGPRATRVLPDGWYVAGPFEAQGARSLNEVYPPEIAVDLDAAYVGQGGRLLEWRWVPSSPYPLVPPHRAENAVYYAWTEIHVDRAQDVLLEIGADDDSKLWLNDELVWVSELLDDKPWYHQPFHQLEREIAQLNLVEGKRLVHLRAGRNTLLFKLYNGIDLMFFSVVLTPSG